ncbi:MAG: CHASE2 domain-containing protein [Candidatus Omnitrophica bacterium]|nr:CHASE2 domain-containing protein [Candidatus Omnitrophota bacterium]
MRYILKYVFAFSIYLIVLFLYKNNKFEKLEFLFYDLRLKNSTLKENLPIVVVGITEDFEREIGEPFSRKHYSEILKILKDEKAELVVFDIFFPTFTSKKEDFEFLKSIKENGCVILPVFSPIKLSKREGEVYIIESLRGSVSEFENNALSVGHINTFQDKDQIVRKMPAFIKYKNKIYSQIGLETYRIMSKRTYSSLKNLVPLDKDGCFYIRYISPTNINQHFISFSDVLKKKYDNNFFQKKVVIIGQTIVGAKNADLIPTPLGTQFGVFVQASAIGTAVSSKYIIHISSFIFLFIYALFLCLIFSISKISLNTIYTFVFSGIIFYGSLFLMKYHGIFLDVVPFLFFTIFYYLSFVFYSLFLAIRKLFQKETMFNLVKNAEKEFTELLNPIEAFKKEESLFLGFGSETLIEKTPSIVLKTILVCSGIESGCFVSVSDKKMEILAKEGEEIENIDLKEIIKGIEKPKIIKNFKGGIKNIAVIPILLFPDFKIYGIFINKKPTPFSRTSKFTLEDINLIETLSIQGLIAIQNFKLNTILKDTQLETIFRLAMAIEYRDRETGGHIQRVSEYSYLIAKNLGFKENESTLIKNAIPLHDLGKIAIPDSILLKPGKLTNEERKIVETHPIIGAKMLSGSNSIILKAAEIIALSHHEKYDGTGYPYKLSGNEIPVYGRIAMLSDIFDALTSKRIYKNEIRIEDAFEIINEEKGKSFDPKIVDVFLKIKDEIRKINEKYKFEALWEL